MRERSQRPTPKRASPRPARHPSETRPDARRPQAPPGAGPASAARSHPLGPAGEAGLGAFGPLGSPVQRLQLPCRASLLGEDGDWATSPDPAAGGARTQAGQVHGHEAAGSRRPDTTPRADRPQGQRQTPATTRKEGGTDRPHFSRGSPCYTHRGLQRGPPLSGA